MRSHWGLGIGHVHAHHHVATSGRTPEEDTQSQECEIEEKSDNVNAQSETHDDGNSDVHHSDGSELGLEDRHLEGWEDVESDDPEGDEDTEGVDFTGM